MSWKFFHHQSFIRSREPERNRKQTIKSFTACILFYYPISWIPHFPLILIIHIYVCPASFLWYFSLLCVCGRAHDRWPLNFKSPWNFKETRSEHKISLVHNTITRCVRLFYAPDPTFFFFLHLIIVKHLCVRSFVVVLSRLLFNYHYLLSA